MNIRLTTAQRAKASKLADDETITTTELGRRSMAPDVDGSIAAWAVWLREDGKRRDRGIQTPGYTGRNHK